MKNKITKLGVMAVRRNPLIADLFHRVKYVEKMGTGLQRINDSCQKRNIGVKIETNGYFKIRFEQLNPKVGEKVGEELSQNQDKILMLIRKNSGISAKILSEKIGISSRKIESNISILKSKKILKRIRSCQGWILGSGRVINYEL